MRFFLENSKIGYALLKTMESINEYILMLLTY